MNVIRKIDLYRFHFSLIIPAPVLIEESAMNNGRSIFAQLVDYLPKRRFQSLVTRYKGDYKCQKLSCYDHLLTMLFAQLASCDCLRDVAACLSANPSQLYHLGIRCRIRHSTLADANERRSARIFEDFAKIRLIRFLRGWSRPAGSLSRPSHQSQFDFMQ